MIQLHEQYYDKHTKLGFQSIAKSTYDPMKSWKYYCYLKILLLLLSATEQANNLATGSRHGFVIGNK